MATITEDYVSFETAKLLKEKGFDGDTSSCYILKNSKHRIMSDKVVQNEYYESQDSNEHGHLIQAPTLQMAMRWLREVHCILLWVYHVIPLPVPNNRKEFIWEWEGKRQLHEALHFGNKQKYKSYEDAVEASIVYCLENLI